MGRYLHTLVVFYRIVALCLAMLVMVIPITRAYHTHLDDKEQCAEHQGHHHHDTDHKDTAPPCDLCEFYAHFTPNEPYVHVLFSFEWITIVPISNAFGYDVHNYDGGILRGLTDRGPPSC